MIIALGITSWNNGTKKKVASGKLRTFIIGFQKNYLENWYKNQVFCEKDIFI